jgi:hypothetical protein
MPFFENTEILWQDVPVQVLDHILTMEINLDRPKVTTANAWATRPPKTVEIYGGRVTLIRNMIVI